MILVYHLDYIKNTLLKSISWKFQKLVSTEELPKCFQGTAKELLNKGKELPGNCIKISQITGIIQVRKEGMGYK